MGDGSYLQSPHPKRFAGRHPQNSTLVLPTDETRGEYCALQVGLEGERWVRGRTALLKD